MEGNVMGTTVSIISGKGGVGKTTCCCYLGRALAKRGNKTIIVELDAGLRGMDLLLGISDAVYALDDLLDGSCDLQQAVLPVPGEENLSLITAPAEFDSALEPEYLMELTELLKEEYDYILFDAPAGSSYVQATASFSDLVILMVLPDAICLRDAVHLADYLRDNPETRAEIRLLINRVSHKALRHSKIGYLDEMIDQTGVSLIGVLPESPDLLKLTTQGAPLKKKKAIALAFDAIAARIEGQDRPLVLY